MKLASRNIGTFHIDYEMIESFPDEVVWLLSKVFIIRAEYEPAYEAIKYTAICPLFYKCPKGYIPYHYDVAYERSQDMRTIRVIGFRDGDKVITWGR